MTMTRLQQLDQRLAELGLRAEDLVERFVRASGPGGQHVNRTASAVQLVHGPSGLETRAESERSQLQNRIAAREQLIARVEAQRAAAAAARRAAAERERRRRRRPPPGVRREMVVAKRRRGALKRQRGPATADD
ncbi:MAG: peptide chain release factor-like protein [Proteobacteria bacterium]|nr:peptide chain release factor-like protein [Pseudomonadota bacterium]